MRWVILLVLTVAAARPAAAADEAAKDAALRDYVVQVGAMATYMGWCERFLPAGYSAKFLADLREGGALAEITTDVAGESYRRARAAKKAVDADMCQGMIQDQAKRIDGA